jgi:amidase
LRDPLDPATRPLKRPVDYTAGLDKDALKGARIGVPSDPDDPLNDVYFGKLSPRSRAVMERAFEALQDLGATLVRASIPTAGWVGGPGTTMNVLNTNSLSRRKGELATPPIVFIYEFKRDLNLYLRDWAVGTRMKSLRNVVAFNQAHAKKALRFSQDLALAAEATRGDLSELEYRSARAMDLLATKIRGLDPYIKRHRLDAVVFPAALGSAIAAKPGYPSVQVPAGFTSGFEGRKTPHYPIGLTFTGPAWSEAKLLRLAYAFEQGTKARRAPSL